MPAVSRVMVQTGPLSFGFGPNDWSKNGPRNSNFEKKNLLNIK